jgi:hypothetical protein
MNISKTAFWELDTGIISTVWMNLWFNELRLGIKSLKEKGRGSPFGY